MITTTFNSNEEWLASRRGKITGSRLKDVLTLRGTGKKKGFYELIAERVSYESDGENPMDRGHRLENEAIVRFTKETGLEVDTSLVVWSRNDDESIAVSPDGFIDREHAVEVKCLNSASHLEAYLTNKIPKDYEFQTLQYFIVNDDLQKLSVVFYDPRVPCKDYFTIELKREDFEKDITQYLEEQKNIIKEVEDIVNSLINF
jgi:predicted phage-related endonuclease